MLMEDTADEMAFFEKKILDSMCFHQILIAVNVVFLFLMGRFFKTLFFYIWMKDIRGSMKYYASQIIF